MFLQAEKAELPRILDYYKKDLRNCLYGYIDIKKYGIEDPNLNLYYSEKDGALNAVATEYYGGIQLYSFENRGVLESILSFLREKESPSINGSRELLEQIYPCLKAEYELAVGFVSRMGNGCLETEEPEEVEEAGEEDYLEIARLICSDRELGGLSDPGKLSRQFLKRSRERFGRHFIIRQDGEIVCHAATYAEADNLAVISGVITREDWLEKRSGNCAGCFWQRERRPTCFITEKMPEDFTESLALTPVRAGEGSCAGKGRREHEEICACGLSVLSSSDDSVLLAYLFCFSH